MQLQIAGLSTNDNWSSSCWFIQEAARGSPKVLCLLEARVKHISQGWRSLEGRERSSCFVPHGNQQ